MFRKPFGDYDSRGSVPLRAFDRRRLKSIIVEEFSVALVVAELLVPEELFSVRFKTCERALGTAYVTSEGVPLWFTLGKDMDDPTPTVYTLWRHPDLLPILSIPGPMVPSMLHGPFLTGSKNHIKFLPPASIPAGKLVCITREYEPTAMGRSRVGPALAVGRMLLPSHAIEGGKKGKVLTLLHAWKDQLWVMGGEERPPRPRLLNASPDEEDDGEEEWESEEFEADAESQSESSSDGGTPKCLSPEEVSDALRSALLKSIFVTLSKLPPGSFPITSSIFYETYILPYRSSQLTKVATTPVDIKHSGFKSLNVFLKARAKEGLINIKESKGGMVITGVEGSHPSVRAHVRDVAVKDVKVRREKHIQPQEMEVDDIQHRKGPVKLLRKPGPVNTAFFRRIGKDPEELFTGDDIKAIINQYIESRHLKPHDQHSVNVAKDKFLLDIVSNGDESIRTELLEKKFMDVNGVIEKVINSMEAWYQISAGDWEPIIRKGNPPPIRINIVRRKGHIVTYISGFETYRLDGDSLAQELRITCASSTAVQPNFRNSSSDQIMVQGEQVKAVTECLIARGIQRRWIEVINRTGVKFDKTKTGERWERTPT